MDCIWYKNEIVFATQKLDNKELLNQVNGAHKLYSSYMQFYKWHHEKPFPKWKKKDIEQHGRCRAGSKNCLLFRSPPMVFWSMLFISYSVLCFVVFVLLSLFSGLFMVVFYRFLNVLWKLLFISYTITKSWPWRP